MSSFNTSMRSQNHRLKTILSNNNMLENSEIVPKEDIDDEDKIEISEILNYFERNHSLEDVKYLPKDFEIHNMKNVFGFNYKESNIYPDDYFFFNTEYGGQTVVNIKDYDYYIENYKIYRDNIKVQDMNISYDMENMILKISKDGNIIYEANLKTYGDEILEKNKEHLSNRNNVINVEDSTIIEENEYLELKYIISNISGKKRF